MKFSLPCLALAMGMAFGAQQAAAKTLEEACALSTKRRTDICLDDFKKTGLGASELDIAIDIGLFDPADYQVVDNEFWITPKVYPVDPMGDPAAYKKYCRDAFGPTATALTFFTDIWNTASTRSRISDPQVEILNQFFELEKAGKQVLMNTNGHYGASDQGALLYANTETDFINGREHFYDPSFKLAFVQNDKYPPIKPNLHVACTLSVPPPNAQAMEDAGLDEDNASLGGAPAPQTPKPTAAPTKGPTAAPEAAAGAAGAPALQAKSHGDPHFKTFSGIKYDFHGACDLVLFDNSNLADGLGVSVHVRTKIKTWWSYIESAVLRVGKNTLEVMGGINGGQFWINGKEQTKPEEGDSLFLSGLKVSFHRVSNKQFRFRLDFGQGDAIAIETFKSFVAVNIRAKTDRFKGSAGLLGSFPEGKMLARDGKTLVEGADSFGKEWQVLASEPMLFHSMEGPQHPQECAMPDKAATKTKKRRLGETLITEEDAVIACANVSEDDQDACVFDVLATNDKEMAGSY